MRKMLVLILILAVLTANAQRRRSTLYPKNIVGIETGMFHRGLIGASYLRINPNHERWMFGAGGGAGIATKFQGLNQFYFVTAFAGRSILLGPGERFYLFLGSDFKYVGYRDVGYHELTGDSYTLSYSGFAFTPYASYGFHWHNWFYKLRAAPWIFWLGEKHPLDIGGVGITVGRKF